MALVFSVLPLLGSCDYEFMIWKLAELFFSFFYQGAALLELPRKWLRLKKRCQFSLSMIDGCWGVGKEIIGNLLMNSLPCVIIIAVSL